METLRLSGKDLRERYMAISIQIQSEDHFDVSIQRDIKIWIYCLFSAKTSIRAVPVDRKQRRKLERTRPNTACCSFASWQTRTQNRINFAGAYIACMYRYILLLLINHDTKVKHNLLKCLKVNNIVKELNSIELKMSSNKIHTNRYKDKTSKRDFPSLSLTTEALIF